MNRIILLAFLLLPISLAYAEGNRAPRYFQGERLERTVTVEYRYPPEDIFPLLCPVREYDWMASWKGTIVYTESGFAEQYVVFYHSIPFPMLFRKAYWTATRYEPNEFIQWCITVPGISIIVIDNSLEPLDGGGTRITSRYHITGVSRFGNRMIHIIFAEENLEREMIRTRDEIEYYLENGTMLPDEYESKMFN